MIALVILGLGLLFIAAALPVGLEYTRQTIDMATADAAGDYAVRQLEMVLRTSRDLNDNKISSASGGRHFHRLDMIERARDINTFDPHAAYTYPFQVRPSYEPVFKVRPFALGNVSMNRLQNDPPGRQRGAAIVDDPETTITQYLAQYINVFRTGVTFDDSNRWLEVGIPYNADLRMLSLVRNPVLSGVARVYPPLDPLVVNDDESGFRVRDFYQPMPNSAYHPYMSRTMNNFPVDTLYSEREKALDRRISWTAFYRRISYKANAGQDAKWYNPNDTPYNTRSADDVAESPLLYEIIYIITQRPTVNHRFPNQDVSGTSIDTFLKPTALNPTGPNVSVNVGADRLAPTPWLGIFTEIPTPPPFDHLLGGTFSFPPNANIIATDRYLNPNFNPGTTLTFKCTRQMGYLLPPGSIFIPALNDQGHNQAPGSPPYLFYQRVGFVPSAPETLPIYEVLERIEDPRKPNETTLIVKNPGFYPWLNAGLSPIHWPVWIIPPAFERRDLEGQPVYEAKSPIVKIIRRTITLPEVHR